MGSSKKAKKFSHADHKAAVDTITKSLENPQISSDDDDTEKAFADHVTSTLQALLTDVSTLTEPKAIFENGLRLLNEVEAQRFVVENLLEAVKKGGHFVQTIEHYNHIGLTNIDLRHLPAAAWSRPSDGAPGKPGSFLKKILAMLKWCAAGTIQLICNAFSGVPEFVGIEPIVGLAGPFPTVSFAIKAETKSVKDVFDLLTKGLR